MTAPEPAQVDLSETKTYSYEFKVDFTGTATVYLIAESEEEARSIADNATPDDPEVSSFDIDEKSITVDNAELLKVEDY